MHDPDQVDTVEVIAQCFTRAESRVCEVANTIRFRADEEAITNDLERDLATELRRAGDEGTIEQAFANDLRRLYWDATSDNFRIPATGLRAEVC